MFLGEDLLAYLVLALGAAMAIGSLARWSGPPTPPRRASWPGPRSAAAW